MSSELGPYHAKRRAGATPEPQGDSGPPGARRGLFVVHKHAARRLHFDLRLELGGALKSWAVPQGPSFDPSIKRLAVRTEDHPLDYADFEGVIPEGNYGAGSMIVWDQGRWVALEPAEEGLEKGKLLFELHGYKLRGRWTLVRTRAKHETSENWLLIKKPDAWSQPDLDRSVSQRSVVSGLDVAALPERRARRLAWQEALAHLPEGPRQIPKPLLAERGLEPVDDPEWIYELKYDGFRLLARKRQDAVSLRFRSGKDSTHAFPEIVKSLRNLNCEDAILDGEVVVLDEEARPRFHFLQRRVQLQKPGDIERASIQLPATYYVFDLISLEGRDLRKLSLRERKHFLKDVVPPLGPVRFTDHVDERGLAFFEQVERMGLEGMMAKDGRSPYVSGRSSHWLKFPLTRTEEFAIVGYTAPRGLRTGFGGLLLASFAGDEWVYSGGVGSGFDHASLQHLKNELDPLEVSEPPCTGAPAREDATWTRPVLVAEVRYLHRSEDGILRQPVFLGLRPDKSAESLRRESWSSVDHPATTGTEPTSREDEATSGADARESASSAKKGDDSERKVGLVNLQKVFWPQDGWTKGDLIEFYRSVSPALLPLLRDRPAVLTRYPDGIEGKHFFQKNTPGFAPEWLRRARMWSEHAEREIEYLVLDDEASLVYAANSGSIPLHVWASRLASLSTPDWLVIDLDPKGAPFPRVVALARGIHRLLDEIGLPSMPKTSGATGLHVLVPLGRQLTFEQTTQLGLLLARVAVMRFPEIATIDRMVQARKGRIYVDVLQNGHGKLLVSAYSVRPLPGAPVSTPLHWREVTSRLEPRKFSIKTVPRRLQAQKKDPWAGILELKPDLLSALERLQALI
ncbi:MAG: DNA ligase D [Myxococcota bacterium]